MLRVGFLEVPSPRFSFFARSHFPTSLLTEAFCFFLGFVLAVGTGSYKGSPALISRCFSGSGVTLRSPVPLDRFPSNSSLLSFREPRVCSCRFFCLLATVPPPIMVDLVPWSIRFHAILVPVTSMCFFYVLLFCLLIDFCFFDSSPAVFFFPVSLFGVLPWPGRGPFFVCLLGCGAPRTPILGNSDFVPRPFQTSGL